MQFIICYNLFTAIAAFLVLFQMQLKSIKLAADIQSSTKKIASSQNTLSNDCDT